jgi:hypothetical protein
LSTADIRGGEDVRLTEPLAAQIEAMWSGGADSGKTARELQDDLVRKVKRRDPYINKKTHMDYMMNEC